MKKNLIICSTPLHVVIAERIIDMHPNEEFWGCICGCSQPLSAKYSYYAKRLKDKCGHEVAFLYPIYNESSSSILRLLHSLKVILCDIWRGYCLISFDTILMPDLFAEEICYFIHNQRRAEVKTFDDGTLNLMPITREKVRTIKRGRLYHLMKCVFRLDAEADFIRRLTEHFTIYKQKNAIEAPKMTYIDLFPSRVSSIKDTDEVIDIVSIFLGQPIYEFEYGQTYRSAEVTQYLIDRYGIRYYYPHPRESYEVKGVEYIHSPLIIEDYLLQELAQCHGKFYKIYTYCSSAVLNLQGLPSHIEFVAIYPTDCPERLKEAYDLFRDCGITIEEVDTSVI